MFPISWFHLAEYYLKTSDKVIISPECLFPFLNSVTKPPADVPQCGCDLEETNPTHSQTAPSPAVTDQSTCRGRCCVCSVQLCPGVCEDKFSWLLVTKCLSCGVCYISLFFSYLFWSSAAAHIMFLFRYVCAGWKIQQTPETLLFWIAPNHNNRYLMTPMTQTESCGWSSALTNLCWNKKSNQDR